MVAELSILVSLLGCRKLSSLQGRVSARSAGHGLWAQPPPGNSLSKRNHTEFTGAPRLIERRQELDSVGDCGKLLESRHLFSAIHFACGGQTLGHFLRLLCETSRGEDGLESWVGSRLLVPTWVMVAVSGLSSSRRRMRRSGPSLHTFSCGSPMLGLWMLWYPNPGLWLIFLGSRGSTFVSKIP